MPDQIPPTCDVKIKGAWHALPLAEAHARHTLAEKRCPACHGRVAITGTFTAKIKLAMVHRRAHDGCPLLPRRFKGAARPHPQAVT